MGLEGHAEAASELGELLGAGLVELPTLPPSVPGLRLELALTSALREAGARLQVGARTRVTATHVELEAAGHPLRLPVRRLVLASGGFASGGLEVLLDGSMREAVADLPVWAPEGTLLFGRSFFEPGGHPAGLAGVRVDRSMQPVDASGAPAAGSGSGSTSRCSSPVCAVRSGIIRRTLPVCYWWPL